MKRPAYLGLGSNLGDRARHLRDALDRIAHKKSLKVQTLSPVYETKPVGKTDQPDFLNMVVKIMTDHSPRALLKRCQEIETELGRVRREHWGPRTIDIDILWYDDCEWSDSELVLPHPWIRERAFVLAPLADIAPELVLGGETVAAAAARIGQEGLKKLGPLDSLLA